jgi:hypothetical protein
MCPEMPQCGLRVTSVAPPSCGPGVTAQRICTRTNAAGYVKCWLWIKPIPPRLMSKCLGHLVPPSAGNGLRRSQYPANIREDLSRRPPGIPKDLLSIQSPVELLALSSCQRPRILFVSTAVRETKSATSCVTCCPC